MTFSFFKRKKIWKILIRDFRLSCFVGVYPQEYEKKQFVVINLECEYRSFIDSNTKEISEVFCYHKLIQDIENFAHKRHVFFLENFAEKIAELCFQDLRVKRATVRVEKEKNIDNVSSVGAEVVRQRGKLWPSF